MPAVNTKASRPPSAAASAPREERNPVDEVVDRKGGARIAACCKLAHVVADAGQAFEPAIVVEQALRLAGSCPSGQ